MECHAPSAFAQFLDLVGSLSVIIAALVALYGIGTWKREHVGRRRIDLAEKTLALFYEARDVINATRSALGLTGDTQLIEQWSSDGNPGPGEPAQAPLIELRLYRGHSKLFSRIRALQFRFAAVFGRNAAYPFSDLLQVRRDICDAEYEFLLGQTNASESNGSHEAQINRLINIMHSGRNGSDPTTQRLNEIVERVEQVCRPVIESYGRTLAAAVLMRGRGVLGILQSQPWFARLRRIWT